MQSVAAAADRLCDPKTEVSAHYLIDRFGEVIQLVDERQRAWHAGAGEWRGQTDINSRSIGIELDNTGKHPFPEPQMQKLETLLQGVIQRWSIEPHNVIGHSDMAPGRKIDPGPKFDWQRLAHMGLALPTGFGDSKQPADAVVFRQAARNAGYTADVDDETLLAAVRLRHRPFAIGPLVAADIAALDVDGR